MPRRNRNAGRTKRKHERRAKRRATSSVPFEQNRDRHSRPAEAPHCPVSGKRSYATFTAAQDALADTALGGRLESAVYHCPDCGDYHLTSARKVTA